MCLDCISSLGVVPVDLTGVYLASGASGKGLRAYPGLSMVFYHHEITPARLPRYLDLGYYAREQGIPFTFSSNLLHALHAALRRVDWPKRFADVTALSVFLKARLLELGFNLLGADAQTSPGVFTLALPTELNSVQLGDALQEAGYLLSYNSEYLRRRNFLQICLLGECTQEKVVSLLNALHRVSAKRRSLTTAGATVA